MMTPQRIGEKVRAQRKALGLTQIGAAGLCGVKSDGSKSDGSNLV